MKTDTPDTLLYAYLRYALLLAAAAFVPFFDAKFLIMAWLLGWMQVSLTANSITQGSPPVSLLGKHISPAAYLRLLSLLPLLAAWDEDSHLEVWQVFICYLIAVSLPMWWFAHRIQYLLMQQNAALSQRRTAVYALCGTLAMLIGIAVFIFAAWRSIRRPSLFFSAAALTGALLIRSGWLMWRQILCVKDTPR